VKIDVPCIAISAVTTRDDTTGRRKSTYEKRKKKTEGNDTLEKKEIKEYVFVYEDGVAVMHEVTTGVQDNKYIEIETGLKEGVQIITGPYSAVSKTLKNRDKVEESSKDEMFTSKED